MAYQKIAQLVKRLADQTAAGLIAWQPTAVDDMFMVSFPKYSVSIQPTTDQEGVPFIEITVRDGEGRVLESVNDGDLDIFVEKPYQLLSDMHASARRQALGVNQAIDELLRHLGKNDTSL
jgi:hypothetical protein